MVYVTGDLHGEYAVFPIPPSAASKKATPIVCGDFGFLWKGGKKEEACSEKSAKSDTPCCFSMDSMKILSCERLSCHRLEWGQGAGCQRQPYPSAAGGTVYPRGGKLFHLRRRRKSRPRTAGGGRSLVGGRDALPGRDAPRAGNPDAGRQKGGLHPHP